MKKTILLFVLIISLFLVGCRVVTMTTSSPPVIEKVYPILKIADCNGLLVLSDNSSLEQQWNSGEYSDWRETYSFEQFFYKPVYCSSNYNWSSPDCKIYADAVTVYQNCSIYYVDTKWI